MKKTICVLLIISMLLCLAACGDSAPEKTGAGEATTAAEASAELTETVKDGPAAPVENTGTAGEEKTDAAAETETGTKAAEGTSETGTEASTKATAAPAAAKKPETKAEILAEYTRIMNQAKKDKPGFTFYEWQTLPDDPESRVITEGKSVIGTALSIANGFMKDEAKAKKDAAVIGKDSDMYCFPIRDSDYGCLLTDANAIKSAKFEQLPNGNNRITIVLNSEKTPEPVTDKHSNKAPSNHGAIFQPLPRQVIDDVLANDVIGAITSDVSFSYTYHDCKAIVEYEPQTGHVVNVTQLSYVTITGSGKVTLIKLDIKKQEFINEMHVVDIIY